MDIKSNKNMDIGIILLGKEDFTLKNTDIIEQNGYSIIEYSKDGYKGYKISKRILNIDSVSKKNKVTYDLLSFNKADDDLNDIFTFKTSFFNNTYKADFVIPDEDYLRSNIINLESLGGTVEELKFVLNTPTKCDNNNADEVLNNGKTLIWNLNSIDKNIRFSFTIHNFAYYVVFVAVAVILLVIIAEFLLSITKYLSTTVKFNFKRKSNDDKKFFKKEENIINKKQILKKANRKEIIDEKEDINSEENIGMFR